jgi:hypothetical protein
MDADEDYCHVTSAKLAAASVNAAEWHSLSQQPDFTTSSLRHYLTLSPSHSLALSPPLFPLWPTTGSLPSCVSAFFATSPSPAVRSHSLVLLSSCSLSLPSTRIILQPSRLLLPYVPESLTTPPEILSPMQLGQDQMFVSFQVHQVRRQRT